MHSRLDELRLAVMFLTRLPVGTLTDPPPLSRAAWAFPLVGLIPGLAGWLALSLTGGVLGGMLAVLAMVLITGALHHDGLADFADGIWGGRDKARVLEIMRDSRTGSYGVLALILFTTLPALAMAEVGASLPAFLFAGVSSRLAMLVAMTRMPPARTDGLGEDAGGRANLLWGAIIVAFLGLWTGAAAIPAALIAAAVAFGLARLALKRIGGQTGDVLGAIQLTSEAAIWVTLAALSG
ncbi:adenosylcobinamide-GDP ribazoletransferase [Palleronia caenipelagi]|uniref:Adenosylcobinamide-GDP ribazoletransferase n=1 Tax=Palleronia caenipelagi TaxID=2489174 RepID=A0A547Q8I7_9RHOB|nr:adenosylcobinamide-GDP ribazoletransferase [Palleronia caenipelagi]TRD22688.1 adenosylcobinamide-GDP ribazoletransferase [Palleronia caenipelagi]